jgi:hypothetical protein
LKNGWLSEKGLRLNSSGVPQVLPQRIRQGEMQPAFRDMLEENNHLLV